MFNTFWQNLLAIFLLKQLKLEKCLLLHGNGANGKSVFFDIINALVGKENVTNFSLTNLSEEHNRALIAYKLLNFGSEINATKINIDLFKQMVSNETIQCRFKYGNTFECNDYARLIFNCNELPKHTEASHAFFRRFLIIPFDVTIPREEADPQLASKIIKSELAGIFNWVIAGVERLLTNKDFSTSDILNESIEKYQRSSDSVASFFNDKNYVPSTKKAITFQAVYDDYVEYCKEEGRRPLAKKNIGDRLKRLGFEVVRRNTGMVVFLEEGSNKNVSLEPTPPTLFTPAHKLVKIDFKRSVRSELEKNTFFKPDSFNDHPFI